MGTHDCLRGLGLSGTTVAYDTRDDLAEFLKILVTDTFKQLVLLDISGLMFRNGQTVSDQELNAVAQDLMSEKDGLVVVITMECSAKIDWMDTTEFGQPELMSSAAADWRPASVPDPAH